MILQVLTMLVLGVAIYTLISTSESAWDTTLLTYWFNLVKTVYSLGIALFSYVCLYSLWVIIKDLWTPLTITRIYY